MSSVWQVIFYFLALVGSVMMECWVHRMLPEIFKNMCVRMCVCARMCVSYVCLLSEGSEGIDPLVLESQTDVSCPVGAGN